MKDATNYIHNLDKPREEQRFLLSVNYIELKLIEVLAQNPQETLVMNAESDRACENLVSDVKAITDRLDR